MIEQTILPASPVVGILLAAGFSRRFGAVDKLLQPVDGEPMALLAARHLIEALPLSVAVVRTDSPLATELAAMGFIVTRCDASAQLMADSLVRGLQAAQAVPTAQGLSVAPHGYVIALADMPFIQPATIAGIATTLLAGAPLVQPVFYGQRGHPVAFAHRFYDELLAIRGDQGARAVLKLHADELTLLSTMDEGILRDIDTPADLP